MNGIPGAGITPVPQAVKNRRGAIAGRVKIVVLDIDIHIVDDGLRNIAVLNISTVSDQWGIEGLGSGIKNIGTGSPNSGIGRPAPCLSVCRSSGNGLSRPRYRLIYYRSRGRCQCGLIHCRTCCRSTCNGGLPHHHCFPVRSRSLARCRCRSANRWCKCRWSVYRRCRSRYRYGSCRLRSSLCCWC